MLLRVVLLCAAMVLWSVAGFGSSKVSESQSVLKLPHRVVDLRNGFRIYLVRYPSPQAVAYQFQVRVGSRNEVEQGKTGFAHFFEHLMFRGTTHRSSKEFFDVYTRLGSENNAWTGSEMTDFHGVVATQYLGQLLNLEADRFKNLHFDEQALKDEAAAVLGEYNKDVAQPEFQLDEKLAETAFKVHPYGHTTMGYKSDILKYGQRYRDVWPFFKRYYRPGNVSLVLVGDLNFDLVVKKVELAFGDWKNPEDLAAAKIPVEPEQKEPRRADVTLGKPTQTRLAVAYKIPAFTTHDHDFATLEVLAEAAFSRISDFQREFHFKKGWVDMVSAHPVESVDPGVWVIQLRLTDVAAGKAQELLAAVEKTVASFREKPLNAGVLAATKKRFENIALTGWFNSAEHLASRLAWYTRFEDDFGVLDRLLQNMNAVTAADVLQFANRNLIPERRTVVILKGSASK